jgi:hypothetical protein
MGCDWKPCWKIAFSKEKYREIRIGCQVIKIDKLTDNQLEKFMTRAGRLEYKGAHFDF